MWRKGSWEKSQRPMPSDFFVWCLISIGVECPLPRLTLEDLVGCFLPKISCTFQVRKVAQNAVHLPITSWLSSWLSRTIVHGAGQCLSKAIRLQAPKSSGNTGYRLNGFPALITLYFSWYRRIKSCWDYRRVLVTNKRDFQGQQRDLLP
jgi:hypothetical protein